MKIKFETRKLKNILNQVKTAFNKEDKRSLLYSINFMAQNGLFIIQSASSHKIVRYSQKSDLPDFSRIIRADIKIATKAKFCEIIFDDREIRIEAIDYHQSFPLLRCEYLKIIQQWQPQRNIFATCDRAWLIEQCKAFKQYDEIYRDKDIRLNFYLSIEGREIICKFKANKGEVFYSQNKKITDNYKYANCYVNARQLLKILESIKSDTVNISLNCQLIENSRLIAIWANEIIYCIPHIAF